MLRLGRKLAKIMFVSIFAAVVLNGNIAYAEEVQETSEVMVTNEPLIISKGKVDKVVIMKEEITKETDGDKKEEVQKEVEICAYNSGENNDNVIATKDEIDEVKNIESEVVALDKSPQTGDNSNAIIWIVVLGVTFVILIVSGIVMFKNKK